MIREIPSSAWWKSSYSGNNGACVEVAVPDSSSIAVRDSKVPKGPNLRFSAGAWSSFVSDIDQGRQNLG